MIKLINSIKIDRSPIAYIDNIIDGISIMEQDVYPSSVFWWKDGIILMEQRFDVGHLELKHELFNIDKIMDKYKIGFDHINIFLGICLIDYISDKKGGYLHLVYNVDNRWDCILTINKYDKLK